MTKNENVHTGNEIKRLLEDIWTFLDAEIEHGQMSSKSKLDAKCLVERCKTYLETVVSGLQLNQEAEQYNTPYVDMQTKTRILDEYVETDLKFREVRDGETVYQDPSLNVSKAESLSDSSTVEEENSSCPYANLPAQQLNTSEKYGHLLRKDKFLFIEQQKKVYAGVQDSFFLIYLSEKDVKPIRTLDLKQYEAKIPEIQNKDQKKKNVSFELVNANNSKSYQFIAPSVEDTMEWVIAINRRRTQNLGSMFKIATIVNKRNLPPLPKLSKEKSDTNTYEILDHDVDYTEIESKEIFGIRKMEIKPKGVPIPLPPRIPEGKVFKSPLNSPKKNIQRIPSEDSLKNDYDPVNPKDEDDQHYDVPDEVTSIKVDSRTHKSCDSDVYDLLQDQNVVAVQKPDIIEITNENSSLEKQQCSDEDNLKDEKKEEIVKPKIYAKPKFFSIKNRMKVVQTSVNFSSHQRDILRESGGKVNNLIHQFTKKQK